MRRMTPIQALLAGAAAGALGSFAQDLFFAATAKIAPQTPKRVFVPPELRQREETSTETLARRTVENVVERGPLEHKELAGKITHYAYGSAWGAGYGLLAESFAAVRTAIGGLLYGAGLWMASDNLILPFFRLRAWPQRYPLKVHAYDLAAHLVYGASVWGAFQAARRRPWVNLVALAGAAWSTRRAPKFLRSPLRSAVKTVRKAEAVVEHAAAL
jgi:uncharacterized membrane protein YagU involved in acid resistance